jgi:hypothetical protein
MSDHFAVTAVGARFPRLVLKSGAKLAKIAVDIRGLQARELIAQGVKQASA